MQNIYQPKDLYLEYLNKTEHNLNSHMVKKIETDLLPKKIHMALDKMLYYHLSLGKSKFKTTIRWHYARISKPRRLTIGNEATENVHVLLKSKRQN